MSSIVNVVKAVQAVRESKTRIYVDTPLTFFSEYDEWLYVEISDDRLCKTCDINANKMEGGVYTGNHLRAYFPYLEILDENTIKVNEHPNCRCILVRLAKAAELPKKVVEPE